MSFNIPGKHNNNNDKKQTLSFSCSFGQIRLRTVILLLRSQTLEHNFPLPFPRLSSLRSKPCSPFRKTRDFPAGTFSCLPVLPKTPKLDRGQPRFVLGAFITQHPKPGTYATLSICQKHFTVDRCELLVVHLIRTHPDSAFSDSTGEEGIRGSEGQVPAHRAEPVLGFLGALRRMHVAETRADLGLNPGSATELGQTASHPRARVSF